MHYLIFLVLSILTMSCSGTDTDTSSDSNSDIIIDSGGISDTDTDTFPPINMEDEVSLERWDLTADTDEWTNMFETMDKKAYISGTLSANSINYGDCKIRLSGETSILFPKKSLRIKFAKDVNHPGYARKIPLRAEYNDPSFMRNWLGYFLFRNMTDIPTPRTRYIELYVNDDYYGLMLHAERIGGKFLEENGRNRDASMYEADPLFEYVSLGAGALMPLDTDDDISYQDSYQKHTADISDPDETDYSDLINFIENEIWEDFKNGNTNNIRNSVHMESFIDYLAVMAIIQGQDHIQKNYYFSYQKPEGTDSTKWEFYPWDLDLTFGCTYNIGKQSTLCQIENIVSMNSYFSGMHEKQLQPVFGDLLFYNMLIHTTLWDEEHWDMLKSRICDMLDSKRWKEDLPTAINYVESLIKDSVVADVNDRNESLEDFNTWVDTIRDFTEDREAYLRGKLQCPIGSPVVTPDVIKIYSDTGIPSDCAMWIWSAGNSGTFTEVVDCPDAPEGNTCFSANHSSWVGWGVSSAIGQNNIYDLSKCDQLSFSLNMTSASTPIKVEIQLDNSYGSKKVINLSSLSTGWQSISIPINDFNATIEQLENVFGLFYITATSSGEFMVDNIKWEGCN